MLLFCHLTVHAGVSDVRHFNNLIESILEIIQLLAGGLVAKLDNATFIDLALGLDLIQCFIELDNALSDLKREPVLTPTTDDDEEEREESQENQNLQAEVHKQLVRHRVKPVLYHFGVLEESKVDSFSFHDFVLE